MLLRGKTLWILALCVATLGRPGRAAATKLEATLHGSYRISGFHQTDLNLGLRDTGKDADLLGQTTFFEHRLAAAALLKYGELEFDFELEELNGLLSTAHEGGVIAPLGAPEGAPARPELATPLRNEAYGISLNSSAVRKASLLWHSNIGLFSFGATTSSFGMGMLANAGDAPVDENLADQRFGDRVVRAFYATKPLYYLSGGEITEDLTSIIGFDMLLEDETGTLMRPASEWKTRGYTRDHGYAGVFALKHVRGGYSSGLFVTRRSITSPGAAVTVDGQPLDANVTAPFDVDIQAWAFDVYADYKKPLGETKWQAYGAVEAAYVTGSTNVVRNSSCPGNTAASRCDIAQEGGVLKLGAKNETLTAELLAGYASGDGNPFDAKITNFRFDRDFKAGLILFDQVMAWQSAAMVRRATDAQILNVPTAGAELLSTNGAITNALFLQPTVKWQPLAHTNFVGSLLWARSPQRYVDAFWANRTSTKTNAWGQPAGTGYGVELDVGANYKRELTKGVELLFGLAGGYFLPGDAFVVDATGKTMDAVYLVKARTAITF